MSEREMSKVFVTQSRERSTYRGSIAVRLDSSFTGLNSTKIGKCPVIC